MSLTDLKILLPLLNRYDITPKKRFGQHFLCSAKVVDSILTASQGAKGILEIGPGPGVLTSPLSENFEKVLAVEVDSTVLPVLQETAPKARVIHHDVMTFDLREGLLSLPEPRMIVSNMPYNLTGPLLFKIASVGHLFSRSVLMMQKEVGDKILAVSGDSSMGAISVNLQTLFHIQKVCDVSRGSFFPPPKVQSIILSFTPRISGLSESESKDFIKFVRGCFMQPRKTLLNNITLLTPEGKKILNSLGILETVRPHQIPLEKWLELYREYSVLKRSF